MIETPQILRTAGQLTALIHITVPRQDIQKVMGPGLSELGAVLKTQGIAPTGPWFTHHLRRPTDSFDFEICFPVAAHIVPAGRVTAGQLAARTVARTIYHGGYEGLGAGWGELHAWIAAEKHTAATDLWECYLVGPDSSSDPATWRTELNQPLID